MLDIPERFVQYAPQRNESRCAMVDNKSEKTTPPEERICPPYMQNRELSWLTFDERCLEQGSDPSVPLLERMQFVSIFWSNLQEFFMVRVGSLTDLNLLKKEILDNKTKMTPQEQLDAVYARCHELYPKQEAIYKDLLQQLAEVGIHELSYADLNDEQLEYLNDYLDTNVTPFLSPQIINSRHPFPHLQNGGLYVMVRLDEQVKSKSEMTPEERQAAKMAKKQAKNLGADGVTMGLIPMPPHAKRVIKLPGEGLQYILLEEALEAISPSVFSMYKVKHTNIICVTRNADLDTTESADESEMDYRAFMKKILKKRGRLAPVRVECKSRLSVVMEEFLLGHLGLQHHQMYVTSVPLDLGYVFGLPGMVENAEARGLVSPAFSPVLTGSVNPHKPVLPQILEKDIMLYYPYESMDTFVKLLQEAATDPDVISINITLYRLASQSRLAEALISAAEHGKSVTALFELRARFDENNNIEWSQRFEDAGCNVIYGFHEYKTHSKICCITRRTADGIQTITQLGTGNYNEKTAKLYTDLSFITTDPAIGRDANKFFRNMRLENLSDEYQTLKVAPLQIKRDLMKLIDAQIALAKAGQPCGLFFKTNSTTDKDMIEKIVEASQAGVPVTMLVRGISCLVPGVPGYTENVRVVSIVGRLLEHSRIYGFGPAEDIQYFLSSADLMTRNMDKRVEIAWPIFDQAIADHITYYIKKSLQDTAKLRELLPDGTYTPLGAFVKEGCEPFNSQEHFIALAKSRRAEAEIAEAAEEQQVSKISMTSTPDAFAPVIVEPVVAHVAENPAAAAEVAAPADDQEEAEAASEVAAIAAETIDLAEAEAEVAEIEAELGAEAAAEPKPAAGPEAEELPVPEPQVVDLEENPNFGDDLFPPQDAKPAEAPQASQTDAAPEEPAVVEVKPAPAQPQHTSVHGANVLTDKPREMAIPKKRGFFARLFGRK